MTTAVVNPERDFGRREIAYIRARFLSLRDHRRARLRASLTREQQDYLDLLPLLLHANHPLLPGFVNTDTPAGISHYQPSREELMLARRHARSFSLKPRHPRDMAIRGLFLIGSSASLGQGPGSDLDIWLCHRGDLDAVARAALQAKLTNIEAHGHSLNLHVHFFPMHAEAFRDGRNSALSNESSGSTQHHLLLEEFYRSNILLAGCPPLWWLIPPEYEDNYAGFVHYLLERHFIQADDWLDFGGLQPTPAGEFFSAAHWQLYKAVGSPYKSLLKLMLLETFVTQWPQVDWACYDIKRALHSDLPLDPDRLDPYRIVLLRIAQHLDQHGAGARLHLARRALYFKAGAQLSHKVANPGWQRLQLIELTREWGWEQADLARLDGHSHWKLARVIEERNALAAELSHSYRLLTGFARAHRSTDRRSLNELAMLGRKLYADLERRPGKIDRINLGVRQDLHEATLWLRRGRADPSPWQLYLEAPDTQAAIAKSTTSLIEMLAWLRVNGIADHNSQIHISPVPDTLGMPEYEHILRVLGKRLQGTCRHHVDLPDLARPARGHCSLVFINVARSDPASVTDDADAIQALDHLMTTTWGEILVESHTDGAEGLLALLCRHLNLFWPLDTNGVPGLEAYCYSSTRAQILTTMVSEQARDLARCFIDLGQQARYYLRVRNVYYWIEHAAKGFTWYELGGEAELLDHLGEARDRFRAARLQPGILGNSPLTVILDMNRAGEIQVFYRVASNGIGLFVLDDCGALYQQWLAQAQEQHFLTQQARFLDTLVTRRLLSVDSDTLPPAVNFYRVEQITGNRWDAQVVAPAQEPAADYLEVILSPGTGETSNNGFSLTVGSREFDSLSLGDRLYGAVARYVRELRHGGECYPIYLTGVNVTTDAERSPLGVVELLRFKGLLEKRLAQALAAD